jgi:predicted transcriptional regulator
MDIGTTIKKLRLKSGAAQQQIANRLNASMQTISCFNALLAFQEGSGQWRKIM